MALLKTSQVAKMLNAPPQTVRDWCRKGTIPAVRVGGQWRVSTEALAQRYDIPETAMSEATTEALSGLDYDEDEAGRW